MAFERGLGMCENTWLSLWQRMYISLCIIIKGYWKVAMINAIVLGFPLMYRSRISFQFCPKLFSDLGVQCSSLSGGSRRLKAELEADKKAKQKWS